MCVGDECDECDEYDEMELCTCGTTHIPPTNKATKRASKCVCVCVCVWFARTVACLTRVILYVSAARVVGAGWTLIEQDPAWGGRGAGVRFGV